MQIVNRPTWLFVLLAWIVAVSACTSQVTTSGAQAAAGNRYYESGQYADAAATYQALVEAGAEDAVLFYNLGNAHYKMGDLGRAILNYRRAQELAPRDSDVAVNLQLARAQTRDRLEMGGGDVLNNVARRIMVGWTTPEESRFVAMALWMCLCGLTLVGILWPRPFLRYPILVALLLFILSLLPMGLRMLERQGGAPAVIVVESIDVHSGPGTDYITEFLLHTGAEVRVLESRDDWLRIALPGGLQGWVPDQALDEV